MGLYDTITYICPNCGEETNSQTKLGVCQMENLQIGSIFPIEDMCLILKDECHNCESLNCIMIKDSEILELVRPELATHQETSFGNVTKL